MKYMVYYMFGRLASKRTAPQDPDDFIDLDDLGKDGWELISVIVTAHGIVGYFKKG